MNYDELNHWSKQAADWAREYHRTLRDRPVRPNLRPGEFAAKIRAPLPEAPEPIEAIFDDFTRFVPDAMTHWQHPRFFAYFPANAAPVSMLAEQLANAMAAQAMLWQTAPAANEMEEVTIGWLREALGLPEDFTGTIHDSATTATFSAVLTMRERALGYAGLTEGLSGQPRLRLYASAQTHSSVDNLVKVATVPGHPTWSMDPGALDAAIRADLAAGHRPAGVILCTGGTSIGACDDLAACIAVAKEHNLPTHVDAAWAGSAMIAPEFRALWAGVEAADSIVFNPHKWLGAQFDCSVQFLRDAKPQIATMGLRPDYLKTQGADEIVNYNEWTLPLGRRFRALKLWFLIRAEGLSGLRTRIRNHVAWANEAAGAIAALPGFEIVTPPILSLFSFRFHDDARSAALLEAVNADGRIYLTQTTHEGAFVIRVQVGQFDCTRDDVMMIPEVLSEIAARV
jgi:aromatic-L-amino-acid decarboxylase